MKTHAKTWLLCAILSMLTSVALARPSMADVYEDSGGYEWWIVIFAVGWIINRMLGHKDASSMETGLLVLVVVIGIVIFFGLGTAFIGVAKKYPLLAIAIAAFYWWAFNKDKK